MRRSSRPGLTGLAGLVTTLLLLGLTPAAQADTPPANPRLQALLDELVAAGAPGALAAVGDGEQSWAGASGVSRLTPRARLTPDARFRAGSVTKSFLATVTLQLVAEDRLRLDDPVARWLPGLVPNGTAITVRMLLNHTSGLYDYLQDTVLAEWLYNDPIRGAPPRHLVAVAASYPPMFAPGASWSYSNTNYIVLGLILEAVTHRTVHRLVHERIIGPLQLTGTTFPEHDRDVRGYHAHGYRPPSMTGAGYQDVTLLAPSLLWAAGAVVSTVHDLLTFYRALLGGRLLAPAQLAELLSVVPVSPVFGYGLGIYALRGPCGTAWGHDGEVPGYVTVVLNDRAGRRFAVVMVSTEPDETLAPLVQLTIDTAVCQMFGRVPPTAGGTAAPRPALPAGERRADRSPVAAVG